MKKQEYSTIVEIGDDLEFCVVIDGISNVRFGRVIKINKDSKIFDFNCLTYGKKMKKIATDKIYKDVKTVRGVGYKHSDTWV